MPFRLAAIISVALLQWFAATDLAEAQPHKGKIGGGGGFAFLTDPDVEHGRTASFGGFFGLRFNDNVSLEGGLYFVRSNRLFDEFGVVDETPTPAFRFETTRFHADGVLVLNIGQRQPFHPFVLFGAGVERRDNKQTDFTFEFEPRYRPTPTPTPTPRVGGRPQRDEVPAHGDCRRRRRDLFHVQPRGTRRIPIVDPEGLGPAHSNHFLRSDLLLLAC